MTTTYAAFDAQVQREIEDYGTVVSATSRLAWTNDGAADIATRLKCLEDEVYSVTATGVQAYALPDYTLEPKAVYYNGNPLEREDFDGWCSLDATGTPYLYTWASDSIYLRPIPNVTATMRVFRYRTPDPIATVAATTPMPFNSKHDSGIRWYVKSRAYEQMGDWDAYRASVDAYENYISKASTQAGIEAQVGRAVSPREVW